MRVAPAGGRTPTPTTDHTYCDSFCDTQCNANCYSHANDYPSYTNADSHCYIYATTNTDAPNKTIAQTSSYSAAEAQSLIPGDWRASACQRRRVRADRTGSGVQRNARPTKSNPTVMVS